MKSKMKNELLRILALGIVGVLIGITAALVYQAGGVGIFIILGISCIGAWTITYL